jgi:DNA-binding protein HU-beta
LLISRVKVHEASVIALLDKLNPLFTFGTLTKTKFIIMNKSDLIGRIAGDAGITKAQAASALNSFTTATAEALKKVILVGFGTFSVSERNARTGRNPQTGAEIKIAAKKVAKFKAGAELNAGI